MKRNAMNLAIATVLLAGLALAGWVAHRRLAHAL